MATRPTVWPPPVAWLSGWRLGLSGWTQPSGPDSECSLVTLSRPGELAPRQSPVPWSLHLGFPEELGAPAVRLLPNGFVLSFPHHPRGGAVYAILLEEGVLGGYATARLSPSLFSPEQEVQRAEGIQWLDLGPQNVVLAAPRREGHRTLFCLAYGAESHAILANKARDRLLAPFETLIDAEFAKREPFWSECYVAKPIKPLLSLALEGLAGHLRRPAGQMPFRWSSAFGREDDRVRNNLLFPLTSAWYFLDPEVAADLVKSSLSCLSADGFLPAECGADGSSPSREFAWPLVAQSAALVWDAGSDASFLSYVLPRIGRYLARALAHFDPDQKGVHRWQSAVEAFIPETFDANLASADLTTFLLCEIETFLGMADELPAFTYDRPAMISARDLLRGNLEKFFWDPRTQNFRDRYIGGGRIERPSLSAILPLFYEGLPVRYRKPLLRQAAGRDQFQRREGVPSWLPWEGDPAPPPTRTIHQIILLEALRRSGARNEMRRLIYNLTEAAKMQFHQGGLTAVGVGETPATMTAHLLEFPADPTVAGSALTLLLASLLQDRSPSRKTSAAVRWLDQHRLTVLSSALGLVLIGFLVLMGAVLRRETIPPSTLQALAELARQYSVLGRHDEAIEVYREVLRGSRNNASVEILLGNAFLRKGDLVRAEECFRSVLKRDPKSPMAMMNLGLTLYRLNEMAEAASCYEQFLKAHSRTYPRLAQRAEVALEIVRERMNGTARL